MLELGGSYRNSVMKRLNVYLNERKTRIELQCRVTNRHDANITLRFTKKLIENHLQ